MLRFESERLQAQNRSFAGFGALLNNELFHRSLLACALEVILFSYGVPWGKESIDGGPSNVAFPWILPVMHVWAYDFYKVLCAAVADSNLFSKADLPLPG